jgi:hypothetical protein
VEESPFVKIIVKVLPVLDEIAEPAAGLHLEQNNPVHILTLILRSKLLLLFLYLGLPRGLSPIDFCY